MEMNLVFNSETGMFEKNSEIQTRYHFNENQTGDIILKSQNEKEPIKKYDEKTGCFEYSDFDIRKKVDDRKKLRLATDELQSRLDGIKKHLKRQNLENRIGKTGNSITPRR